MQVPLPLLKGMSRSPSVLHGSRWVQRSSSPMPPHRNLPRIPACSTGDLCLSLRHAGIFPNSHSPGTPCHLMLGTGTRQRWAQPGQSLRHVKGFLCLQKSTLKEPENSCHAVIPGFCPKVQRHCAKRAEIKDALLSPKCKYYACLSYRISHKKAGEADTDTRPHQCMFPSCHKQMDLWKLGNT